MQAVAVPSTLYVQQLHSLTTVATQHALTNNWCTLCAHKRRKNYRTTTHKCTLTPCVQEMIVIHQSLRNTAQRQGKTEQSNRVCLKYTVGVQHIHRGTASIVLIIIFIQFFSSPFCRLLGHLPPLPLLPRHRCAHLFLLLRQS